MTHAYFVAKARARLAQAGGDPDHAGPLAEWAGEAKRIGDARRGVIVAEDGELIAETLYHPPTAGSPGATYVRPDDTERYDLSPNEVGMAMGQLHQITGKRLIHVTMPEVCRGAGKHVPEVTGPSISLDPLAAVGLARVKSAAAAGALRVAVADAYTRGSTPTELAAAVGVTRQTIYRWLAEAGFAAQRRGRGTE